MGDDWERRHLMDGDERDFFISYTSADRTWAEWIAWKLEEAGYSTILQAWDFGAGSNFVLEMHSGLSRAHRVIAVLSPSYLTSDFSAAEWAAAFARDPTGVGRLLIPVRIRECQPHGLLRSMVYIDLVALDESLARERLLLSLEGRRTKPTESPPYPGTIRPHRFPGELPPIWNVPERNPNFTGRDALLETLHANLAESAVSALIQAVHGLGGVGKTQLAIEYAWRHHSDYDLVWWVPAGEPVAIITSLISLGQQIGASTEDTNPSQTVASVLRELRRRERWLLVFDNVEDPEHLDQYRLSGRASGHVLVTSRNAAWRSVGTPVEVAAMNPDEAVAFMLRRSGGHDPSAAALIAAELGFLPLALEQAAAYIDETGISLPEYSNLLRDHKASLLKRGNPGFYSYTVATTWELSFSRVGHLSPDAADLLRLCAFLGPDDIPVDLLTGVLDEPSPQSVDQHDSGEIRITDAIAVLRRFSLLSRTGPRLNVHRLVQAVVVDHLDDDARRHWLRLAIELLVDAAPTHVGRDERDFWLKWSRLAPHVIEVANGAERYLGPIRDVGALLEGAGNYLAFRGEFAQAAALFERTLELRIAVLGPDDYWVAATQGRLATMLIEVGQAGRARELYERSLAIYTRINGAHSSDVAGTLMNLGLALRGLKKLDEAEKCMGRALAICEKLFGFEHPRVAQVLLNLGIVLKQMGRYPEARRKYESAIWINAHTLGQTHPTVGFDFNNLAMLCEETGDANTARMHYEKALDILEGYYGSSHWVVAKTRVSLGKLLQQLGEFHRAKELYEEARPAFEQAYGADDSAMEDFRVRLAEVTEGGKGSPRSRPGSA